MRKKPHPVDYFRLHLDHWLHFRERWWDAMSGGASVPFAIFAVIAGTPWGQSVLPEWAQSAPTIAWSAAVICAWIAAYRVWKPEKERVNELEERSRPKLKCTFDASLPGCVIPDVSITQPRSAQGGASSSSTVVVTGQSPWMPPPPPTTMSAVAPTFNSRPANAMVILATYYRVKVDADCAENVEECHGRLEWIKKDGALIFSGDPIPLPFARAENSDSMSKTIHPGGSEFLDFLAITASNNIIVTAQHFSGPSNINWANKFAKPGEYTFHISIFSNSPMVSIEPILTWTGEQNTAEMSCPRKTS